MAAPVPLRCRGQVRAVLDASAPTLHRHRCRLDEGRSLRCGDGGVAAGSWGGPSDLRLGGARAGVGDGRAVPKVRRWFLTLPVASTDPDQLQGAARLRLGARGSARSRSTPRAHDRLVAVTSHLPHALANVLLNQAGGSRIDGHEPLAAAGGSLRDMTRVAGANPRNLGRHLPRESRGARRLACRAPAPRRAGRSGARRGRPPDSSRGVDRRSLRQPAAPSRETAYEDAGEPSSGCGCTCPDRPGRGSRGIAQALGAERINIADFDLQHLSTERGGTGRDPGWQASRRRPGGPAALLEAAGIRRGRGAGARRRAVSAVSLSHGQRRPVRGLSPDVARADVSQLQIFRQLFFHRGRGMKIAPTAAVHGDIASPETMRPFSDRAVLLVSLEATTEFAGCGRSAPPSRGSLDRGALGLRVSVQIRTRCEGFGGGLRGLVAPKKPIDCGNAGTPARLLTGSSSPGRRGQRFELTGDRVAAARGRWCAYAAPSRSAGWAPGSRRRTAMPQS